MVWLDSQGKIGTRISSSGRGEHVGLDWARFSPLWSTSSGKLCVWPGLCKPRSWLPKGLESCWARAMGGQAWGLSLSLQQSWLQFRSLSPSLGCPLPHSTPSLQATV